MQISYDVVSTCNAHVPGDCPFKILHNDFLTNNYFKFFLQIFVCLSNLAVGFCPPPSEPKSLFIYLVYP